jgi:hypothetical protein
VQVTGTFRRKQAPAAVSDANKESQPRTCVEEITVPDSCHAPRFDGGAFAQVMSKIEQI